VEIGVEAGDCDGKSNQAGNDRERKTKTSQNVAEVHLLSLLTHDREHISPSNGASESVCDRHRNEFVEPHCEIAGSCSVSPTAAATTIARLPAKSAPSVIFALLSSGNVHTEFNRFADSGKKSRC